MKKRILVLLILCIMLGSFAFADGDHYCSHIWHPYADWWEGYSSGCYHWNICVLCGHTESETPISHDPEVQTPIIIATSDECTLTRYVCNRCGYLCGENHDYSHSITIYTAINIGDPQKHDIGNFCEDCGYFDSISGSENHSWNLSMVCNACGYAQ